MSAPKGGGPGSKKDRINAVSTLTATGAASRKFFRYAKGMAGYAGVLEHAREGRFGVIPLGLKDVNLPARISIRIFIIAEQEAFNGCITRALKRGRESTPVLLLLGKGRRI